MLLKELYNARFIHQFAEICKQEIANFPLAKFKKQVFQPAFEDFELKQRSTHIAHVFRSLLEDDFALSSKQILRIVKQIKLNPLFESNLPFLFIPEIYEKYGLAHPSLSLEAFEEITSLISCEFAIRPFLENHQDLAMSYVKQWTNHGDEHVRRLASEGIRPKLPWAPELKQFRKDPQPVIDILEKLLFDPSEYVRKSVSNNLNDISKDHPNKVIQLTKQWIGKNKETDKLLKHANRTLLKAGNRDVLKLFSYHTDGNLVLTSFGLINKKVNMGEALSWKIEVKNTSKTVAKVRVEYVFNFLRNNGQWGHKVFKHTELFLKPGESQELTKHHKIVPITTRKYYPGTQQLAVIINGKASEAQKFELNC